MAKSINAEKGGTLVRGVVQARVDNISKEDIQQDHNKTNMGKKR